MFTSVRCSSALVVRLRRTSTAGLWLTEMLILSGSAEQFNQLQIKYEYNVGKSKENKIWC
jgi:hypothetical protein